MNYKITVPIHNDEISYYSEYILNRGVEYSVVSKPKEDTSQFTMWVNTDKQLDWALFLINHVLELKSANINGQEIFLGPLTTCQVQSLLEE